MAGMRFASGVIPSTSKLEASSLLKGCRDSALPPTVVKVAVRAVEGMRQKERETERKKGGIKQYEKVSELKSTLIRHRAFIQHIYSLIRHGGYVVHCD